MGSLDAGEGKLISSELKGNVCFASGHLLYVRARTLMAQPFDTKRMEPTGSAIPLTEQELEQRTIFSHAPAHQGSAPADRGPTLPSPSLPERKPLVGIRGNNNLESYAGPALNASKRRG